MAVRIISPANSFVQFDQDDSFNHCVFGTVRHCLPVFAEDDVNFQFVLETDTEEEADALCDLANDLLTIGLSDDLCYGELLLTFSEKSERFRISPTQVLYNWSHGLPGFAGTIEVGECFKVLVMLTLNDEDYQFCSNCFQRIREDCFTSVIEFGSEDNSFGFNYCASGAIESGSEAGTCDPTIITFANKSTLVIPYTSSLQSAYGDAPTIQVWIYDGSGDLVNMGIQAKLDGFPPTQLEFDFGGPASGIIIIK
jgi:hypothetical protein